MPLPLSYPRCAVLGAAWWWIAAPLPPLPFSHLVFPSSGHQNESVHILPRLLFPLSLVGEDACQCVGVVRLCPRGVQIVVGRREVMFACNTWQRVLWKVCVCVCALDMWLCVHACAVSHEEWVMVTGCAEAK